MALEMKKLSLIAPEERGSKEYFGYHREAVLDAVFGGGVCIKETFDLLNNPNLTLDEAKAFFAEHYEGNEKMMVDGRDLYILNRYINDYVGVPLFYNEKSPMPVNNTVGDYIVDFLVDVKGWAKVQDRIYTADPESYRRFFEYATKGYYINLKNYALKYDFLSEKFVTIDNARRAYMYTEDRELCEKVAHSLSTARVTIFRDAVLSDTERKIRAREDQPQPSQEKLVTLDETTVTDGRYYRPKSNTSEDNSPKVPEKPRVQ